MPQDVPTIEFDHCTPEYASRGHEELRKLRHECPVAYSESYGGMWVVAEHDLVAQVVKNPATFSSTYVPGTPFQGIVIPADANRPTTIPIELDPPAFADYRRMLNPWFSPAAVERLEPKLREVITAVVDRVIESGRVDLVLDVANPVPAIMTLHILGLPLDAWSIYAKPAHEAVYTLQGTPEHDRAMADMMVLLDDLKTEIARRRQAPTDDLISYLTQVEVAGQVLPDHEVLSIVNLVIHGGVDTTTALISNALLYLYQDPSARQQLIEAPEMRKQACEEFLRWFAPIQTQARTVTHDTELGGCPLRAGDRVLVSWASANRDEKLFDRPDEVVLDRFPNRHLAFGLGIHRCVGSNLARAQFLAVLDAVLERMPDYSILDDEVARYTTVGSVNGIIQMPATFTPGERRGTSVPDYLGAG